MYEFELERPTRLADAIAALGEGDAQALAGGQTLIPTLKARLAMPGRLIALSAIPELKGVRTSDGMLIIGGGSTHAQIAREATAYPALAALAGNIGDPAVRNRGTIGGSLANNDPSACYPAAVLASDAVIVTDRREIAAGDYFQGMFTTALDEGELVTELRFRIPQAAHYIKFEQPASRFALVGVFVAETSSGVRVAITGAGNGVFRHAALEDALNNQFAPDAIDSVHIDPDDFSTDLHASAAYRANLAKVLTRRAVARCLGQN